MKDLMVEFVGSTGSGKTTVADAVRRQLAPRVGVDTAPDVVAQLVGLQPLACPLYRNLLCDLVGLPFVVGSLGRHGAFLRYVLRVLVRQRLSLQGLNRVRSTVRKVGVYEIIRRRREGRIVLVDEGTVLHAHNLFVFTSHAHAAAELERFAGLVPLPDVIVYVRAPLEASIRRSLARPDPPREMRARERASVELYVGRAWALFEALVAIPAIRERVVVVDNPDGQAGPGPPEVGGAVEAILARARLAD
jgi:thymidylate kinase